MPTRPTPTRVRPLTAVQQRLAADYRHLGRKHALKAAERHPHLGDEFLSAADLAVVQAASSWDPRRGVKFSTWAIVRIRGALADTLRRDRPRGFRRDDTSAPWVQTSQDHSLESTALDQHVPDPEDDLDRDALLDRVIRLLPPRHALACRMAWVSRMSGAQAGEVLGISSRAFRRLVREGAERIRAEITAQGVSS